MQFDSSIIEPDKNYTMKLENKLTKKIEEEVFSNYIYDQIPAKSVRMPYGYAVPIKIAKTINLLHRHGFISERRTESELFIIQKYLVLSGNYQKLNVNLDHQQM